MQKWLMSNLVYSGLLFYWIPGECTFNGNVAKKFCYVVRPAFITLFITTELLLSSVSHVKIWKGNSNTTG